MITRWGQNAKIELSGRHTCVDANLRYTGYMQDAFCDDDEGGVRKDYLDMASPPGADDGPLRSDDELQQITVGTPQPHNAPIDLAEYDPDWPRLFTREAVRLRDVLGDVALRVEHVGSTSVPGLLAKPIVDVLLVVPNSADEVSYVPRLEAAGYVLHVREPDWFEHRLFKGPDTDINLHVFSFGAAEIDRMLRFRDRLRSSDRDRDRYARTRRDLAAELAARAALRRRQDCSRPSDPRRRHMTLTRGL